MYSTLISAAVGGTTFVLLRFTLGQSWFVAIGVGVLVALLVWFGITWLANKKLHKRMSAIERALTNQEPDTAVRLLEEARDLQRWSFPVGLAIDGQLGVIHYVHKQDIETALPLLQRSFVKNWQAKAMLAAIHYKRKKFDEMEKVWQQTIKANKKESMLYAAWAWIESRRGRREEAVDILERGRKALPDDDALKEALSAVQSGKRMKMTAWEPDWWALRLERPPAQTVTGGRRVGGRYIRRG